MLTLKDNKNKENNKKNGNNRPKLIIKGGKALKGVIAANGAKNAALPIMAASILASGKICLQKVPDISDVEHMARILQFMGAEVQYNGDGCFIVDTSNFSKTRAPYKLVKKLNASFDITGAMVARFGEAHVPLPGGCVIGTRAVDMHLEGFRALGCEVEQEPGGFISVKARKLVGGRVHFRRTSVGATKNVMMAAVLARGKTILENVAREPEVIDLANFLNCCGAGITGHGTGRIEIQGVRKLYPDIEYEIIPDRIESATYLLAGAITGGEVTVRNAEPEYLKTFLRKMRKAGQDIKIGNDYIRITGVKPIQSVGAIITEPYPGFPTDLQPPMTALLSLSNGTTLVKEKIFNMRFSYIDELRRMGADFQMDGNTVIVRGVERLLGAPVEAPDIRAGGALILAALSAEGKSEVYGLNFIDRGYEKIEEKLREIGADIERVG
ncbi:MAG: UDP-N-acetylglucosamine 1-carboxyvinyltransferase [Candidatus Eremiobacteraeota bacterium]|nr:UDP-N-acetylglucosamine 1-carboxyvinyltransferase [Candidatus Eremiobacteraeota bacterium]